MNGRSNSSAVTDGTGPSSAGTSSAGTSSAGPVSNQPDFDESFGVGRRTPRAPVVRGRADGPVQTTCEVMATGFIGAYRSLTIVAPAIAERARPGQFLSLAVQGTHTLLRRPFSIYQVSRHKGGGTVTVIYNVVGEGTRWLAERERHDRVDAVGPLGNGFPLPQQAVPCLLVGGGYGAAPLLYLANALRREGSRVDVIFGASTADRLFNPIEAKRLAASAVFPTDDGSSGVAGRVTDVFDDVVTRTGAQVVYACGPMPMLRAVAEAAAAHKIPCQVAVEEDMACGVGICMSCVVPVHTDDGVRNLRACVEGPVFLGRRIAWEFEGYQLPAAEFAPGPVARPPLADIHAGDPHLATSHSEETS